MDDVPITSNRNHIHESTMNSKLRQNVEMALIDRNTVTVRTPSVDQDSVSVRTPVDHDSVGTSPVDRSHYNPESERRGTGSGSGGRKTLDEMISWYQHQSRKYSQQSETVHSPDLPTPPLVEQPLTEAVSLDQVDVAIKSITHRSPSSHVSRSPEMDFNYESMDLPSGVPRIIHQLAPIKMTDTIKSSILAWKQLHSNWYHILWNPLMLDQLMTRYYPSYQRIYVSLAPNQKPAAIRFFLLHRYGGIYSDVNLRPLIALDRLFNHGEGVYLTQDPAGRFTNQLMGSSAQNDFWLDVVTEMEHPYLPWWSCCQTYRRRYQSGSYLLDRIARRWRGSIILLPSNLVYPCSSCDPTPCTQPGALMELLADSNPASMEERVINLIECHWTKILILIGLIVLLLIVWWYH
jgi:hypothetical protein